jgi:deoxyribodipyrimidine photo-lyase
VNSAVVLFTRDLRVHDNAALASAVEQFETVVPLFVHDERLATTRYGAAERRRRFLEESLVELGTSLRRLGGSLVERRGDVRAETLRVARAVGAKTVFITSDVTAYARHREAVLARELDVRLSDGLGVVPPGEVSPAGRDHYRVFTPYWRAWRLAAVGDPLPTPRRIRLPDGAAALGSTPPRREIKGSSGFTGGERAGTRRAEHWLDEKLAAYAEGGHDRLDRDRTSKLSPYLHFGCISARALAVAAASRGDDSFRRQLAWRDFFAQLLWANPRSQTDDLRSRGDRWRDDGAAIDAWKAGLTGYPLVDAAMRQLSSEGWIHNRARLVAASFLTKHLKIDWRVGADHFADLLVDGDVAQNVGNWQWVAGVGADTRPNRVLNPTAQQRKLDPTERFVRRYVDIDDDYPAPIVDHGEAMAAFRDRRAYR